MVRNNDKESVLRYVYWVSRCVRDKEVVVPQTSVQQGLKRLGLLACTVSIKGYKLHSSGSHHGGGMSYRAYRPSSQSKCRIQMAVGSNGTSR